LSVAPVFGLCFSHYLCALVILFLSASLPDPYSPLMTAHRPAALLLLRSLILAVARGEAGAGGGTGDDKRTKTFYRKNRNPRIPSLWPEVI
jgi:hypothetical protein